MSCHQSIQYHIKNNNIYEIYNILNFMCNKLSFERSNRLYRVFSLLLRIVQPDEMRK